jgi:probable F420-dependent oxidoreductase
MRIGVGLHQHDRWGVTIGDQARRAEAAGFDSVWLGDHIISPLRIGSAYPYSASGEVPWTPEIEMFDAIVCAGVIAAVTERVTIGFGTLVLPLRHPIVLAKQLASLDRLTGGRIVLGAGAGWSQEEFDALHANFADRFDVTAEWIELLRACWRGRPGVIHGRFYDLSVESACYPVPAGRLPVLVGGASRAARELVASTGDGWYPLCTPDQLSPDWLGPRWEQIRHQAIDAGRDPEQLVLAVYAAAELDEVCAMLPDLAGLGVSELVVGVDWDSPDAVRTAAERLDGARPKG